MRIIGIDPGKKGGIAWITPEDTGATIMPLAGKELDVPTIQALFGRIQPGKIIIEQQRSMPGQGVASMFTIGKNYGILLGLAAPYSLEVVTPQRWKKVVLAGTKKDKDASIAYCRQAFPSVSLLPSPRCRKPSDGIADALCLAEFGRRCFSDGALAA